MFDEVDEQFATVSVIDEGETMKTKTKIVNWFKCWYGFSWESDERPEIREIKEILKELR